MLYPPLFTLELLQRHLQISGRAYMCKLSVLCAWRCLHVPHSSETQLAPHTRGFGGPLFTQVSSPCSPPCSGMSLLVGNMHSQDTGDISEEGSSTRDFQIHPPSLVLIFQELASKGPAVLPNQSFFGYPRIEVSFTQNGNVPNPPHQAGPSK